jgi:EAL domain-containing protein (putative c-di-GMP-specific phosphodiesterase class I)
VEALRQTEPADRHAIEAVLADPGLIRPVFQPIVDLRHASVWGFEMLARFAVDVTGSPLEWLAVAERHGLGAELEARLVAAGLAARQRLPRGAQLSINVSPTALVSPEVRDVLDTAPGGLQQIVLEVSGQPSFDDHRALAATLRRVRMAGASVAVDDAGAGSLQNVVRLRPEYVKLDRDLVADADADPDKLAVIEAIGLFAGRLDAALVAGGIERRAEQESMAGLAVPLGQGFYFGRPVAAPGGHRGVLAVPRRPVEEPLSALLDRTAPVVDEALLAAGAQPPAGARGQVVAVLDREGRPTGLAVPNGAGWTRRPTVLAAGVDEEAEAVARRALDRPLSTRLDPVCAVLPDGRYAGLVPVERLLGAGSAISRTPIFLPV